MDANHPRQIRYCKCGCGRPLASLVAQARYHPLCVGVRDKTRASDRKRIQREAQAALNSARSPAIEARIDLELQWIAYRRRTQSA